MRARLLFLAAGLAAQALACISSDELVDRDLGDEEITGAGGAQNGAGAGAGSVGGTSGAGVPVTSGGPNGSTGSAGGSGCSYAASNSCVGAETLTEIAGDAGADVRTASGTTSKFFKVFVAETVSSVVSYPELSFTATLENAPGMDFDLYVYDAGAEPTCDGTPVLAASDPAIVHGAWGDTPTADDGAWFVLEVRYNGGSACGPQAQWSLTVQGNFSYTCQTDGACTLDDDCICPDCDQDAYCSDPAHCNGDGTCDPYNEGCACGDCSSLPQCG